MTVRPGSRCSARQWAGGNLVRIALVLTAWLGTLTAPCGRRPRLAWAGTHCGALLPLDAGGAHGGKRRACRPFEKLNLKQQRDLVVNAPTSFEPELHLKGVTVPRPEAGKSSSLALRSRPRRLKSIGCPKFSPARPRVTHCCGSPIRARPRYKCEFNREPAGASAAQASIRCARSPSTKTGRHCASGAGAHRAAAGSASGKSATATKKRAGHK